MQSTSSGHQNSYEEQNNFSPRKFVLQVQYYLKYLLSKWLWIILITLMAGFAGYFYSSSKKPVYEAEITFALDEKSNPKTATALSQLSESLGLQNAPENGTAFFSSMTNIAELLRSKFLMERTLRDTVKTKKRQLAYMDFFLDSLGYRKKWMKKGPYVNTNWLSNKLTEDEIYFQNGIMSTACETLISQYIKINQKGSGTSIFSVKCVTENQAFSKNFLESLLRNLTDYYTQIRTERAKNNLDFIKSRTDSIQRTFTRALYSKASFSDAHMNPARQVSVVGTQKQETDVQILRASYIELSRALDLARSELINATPLFQYLDRPTLPLKRAGSNPTLYLVVFAFVGFAIAVLFFSMKMVYQLIMNSGVVKPEPIKYQDETET